MNKMKRFFSTTMVYLIGSVLSKLVVFFLLPLYTSRIATEQYGVYDLVLAFVMLFAPIAFFQIWDGMFRLGFDYEKTEDKYKVINNAMLISGCGVIVYTLIFGIVYSILRFDHAVYILLYGLFLSLNYLYGYICRVFLANKLYAISGLISTIVTTVCNVVLIVCFNWDIRSLYLAPILGMALQVVIVECRYGILVKFKKSHINRELIKSMLKFSLPLCLVGASYWLLSGFTKLLITGMLGAAENGIFGIANRFASMVTLAVTIFQYAWNELAYMMAKDEDRVDSYNLCIDLLLKFIFLGGAAICVFIKIIFPFFVRGEYTSAIQIIPATIIGSMMNAMASFVATLFMTEKKTGSIVGSILIAAALNVVSGFFLTKYFGLQGATIALGAGFTLLMVIRLIQAKKQIRITIDMKTLLLLTAILAASIVEYYLAKHIVWDILTLLGIGALFLLMIKKYLKMLFGKKKTEEIEVKEENI